jgi:hypothetical protein
MRSPLIPDGAEIVRTYDQYDALIKSFFQAQYNLLIVIGRPGLAKSYSFEQRLSTTSHLIRGWAAPLQCYIDCYNHRNKLLVFDDAEELWKRPGGRVLLRSLCEHRDRKLVQWTTTAPQLRSAGVPKSFTTTSKVALIANRFVFGDQEEYAAVEAQGDEAARQRAEFLIEAKVVAVRALERIGQGALADQVCRSLDSLVEDS